MGTPRHKPRALLRDSLSSLIPKEGTGRAPSHVPDSDEANDSKRTFVLELEAEFKRAEPIISEKDSHEIRHNS